MLLKELPNRAFLLTKYQVISRSRVDYKLEKQIVSFGFLTLSATFVLINSVITAS